MQAWPFFFLSPIFHTCQSCKPKAKLIKVNGECIFFIKLSFFYWFFSFIQIVDLVLKIKNTVEQRKEIIKLPRWFTNSDTGFQRWLVFQRLLNWQDVENLGQLRTDRPSCVPIEVCEAKLPGTFGLWKQCWSLHGQTSGPLQQPPNFYSHFQSILSNPFSTQKLNASF